MTKQIRTTCALFAGVVLMSAALPGTAFAVDGQIAITQARAMAGGVTPGDAAGFPVTLSQPGSYVLSGNLTVPDANTTAIEIAASHVTIDLNGFAILGSTDCSGGFDPCAGAGNGQGITTTLTVQFNITVRNGTIQGLGQDGIHLLGDSHLVEHMHVRSNGGRGIAVVRSADFGGSIVQNNTVQRNGRAGIFSLTANVAHNVVDANGEDGIVMETGSASQNVVTRNRGFGLSLGTRANYIGNVVVDNGATVSSGLNQGQNMCNTSACPGAQF